MNRNIILIALLGLLFVSKAVAQSVTVEAKIDSLQILIGEQAKVQLQVAMDAKQRAIFPAYTDTLVRGVEIIETVKPDTQFLNDRQRMVITQEYIITSSILSPANASYRRWESVQLQSSRIKSIFNAG